MIVKNNATPIFNEDEDRNVNFDDVIYYPPKTKIWYQPSDWIFPDEYARLLSKEYSTSFKYLSSFYYSILFVGQNEIGPVNKSEIMAAVAMLVASLFINLNLFGEMAGLVANFSLEKTIKQEKIDASNSVMFHIGLDDSDIIEVSSYFKKTSTTKDKMDEFDQFFDTISNSLRLKVQNNMYGNQISKNKVIRKIMLTDFDQIKKQLTFCDQL